MSLKERGQLECIVRDAVRDYLTESLSVDVNRSFNPTPKECSTYRVTEAPKSQDDQLKIAGTFYGEYTATTPRFVHSTSDFPQAHQSHQNVTRRRTFEDRDNLSRSVPVMDSLEMYSNNDLHGKQTSTVDPAQFQQEPADRLIVDAPRPLTTANLLTWRVHTPFFETDEKLKRFRHLQNSKKPEPLPKVWRPQSRATRIRQQSPSGLRPASPKKFIRPHTARPGLVHQQNVEMTSDVDTTMKSWIGNASDYEKKVALNLMKAIESGKREGLEGIKTSEPLPYVCYRDPGVGRKQRPVTPLNHYFPTKRSDPRTLFGGLEEDSRKNKKKNNVVLSKDYINFGAGFQNASPQHRGHFIIHPDWISERNSLRTKSSPNGLRYGSHT